MFQNQFQNFANGAYAYTFTLAVPFCPLLNFTCGTTAKPMKVSPTQAYTSLVVCPGKFACAYLS